jgi:lauroyl/myristoyl acyltransferase
MRDHSKRLWHLSRRVYDRAVAFSDRLDTGTVVDCGAGLGRLAHRIHRSSPSERDVVSLFTGFDTVAVDEPRRTAREISALRYTNRALLALVRRRGLQTLAPLVNPAGARNLEVLRHPDRPTILITWHVGVIFGLAAALTQRNIPVLVVREGSFYEPIGRMEFAFTRGGPSARARTFGHALRQLQKGGLVLMAADGPDGARTACVPCLGRSFSLARGPFGLARLAGAVLVPCVPRWDGDGRIDVQVSPALTRPRMDTKATFETSYAAAAAGWLQTYLLESPQDLWLYTLRRLLSADASPKSNVTSLVSRPLDERPDSHALQKPF